MEEIKIIYEKMNEFPKGNKKMTQMEKNKKILKETNNKLKAVAVIAGKVQS